MNWNKIALLGFAGCFASVMSLLGACGSGAKAAGGSQSTCGDQVVSGTEECDDGNANNNDSCKNDCTKNTPLPNSCGNGKIDQGEDCDNGKLNGTPGDPCGPTCLKAVGTKCGNGMIDAPEECDEGKKNSNEPTATCTVSCKKPACGDGILQGAECCDDGPDNEIKGKCKKDCTCTGGQGGATGASTGAGGMPDPCKDAKIFAKVVSNQTNPNQAGSGVPSVWSYKGLLGVQAGKAMCQDIGADHACSYAEIVKADAKKELSGIPNNMTYWLHRTTNVPDPKLMNGMKACNSDAECGGFDVCDVPTKICSWKPGAGGRCNDWTYPTNHIADGEWFKVSTNDAGGVTVAGGSLSYHFDADTSYDGTGAHVSSKSETTLGTSGGCGNATRSFLCCFPACVN